MTLWPGFRLDGTNPPPFLCRLGMPPLLSTPVPSSLTCANRTPAPHVPNIYAPQVPASFVPDHALTRPCPCSPMPCPCSPLLAHAHALARPCPCSLVLCTTVCQRLRRAAVSPHTQLERCSSQRYRSAPSAVSTCPAPVSLVLHSIQSLISVSRSRQQALDDAALWPYGSKGARTAPMAEGCLTL